MSILAPSSPTLICCYVCFTLPCLYVSPSMCIFQVLKPLLPTLPSLAPSVTCSLCLLIPSGQTSLDSLSQAIAFIPSRAFTFRSKRLSLSFKRLSLSYRSSLCPSSVILCWLIFHALWTNCFDLTAQQNILSLAWPLLVYHCMRFSSGCSQKTEVWGHVFEPFWVQ